MATIEFTLNGKKETLYMDNGLHRQVKVKLLPALHKKDNDFVVIIDGAEGSGKSVFAQQLAITVDPSFNLDRMCMSPNEFTKAVLKATKGQCVVFDEAFTGLSSRASLTEINKLLVSLMMEMRQKNLFVIIVMPTFFLLDRYVSLFRARGLFHIYLKNNRRGQWVYFNNKKKKLLYLTGKKLFSYAKPKSRFRGRFFDKYTIDEQGYRDKKAKNLLSKSRNTKAQSFKLQRDTLFYILVEKFKQSYRQLAKLCKEHGYKVDASTINDAVIAKKQEYINEEVDL